MQVRDIENALIAQFFTICGGVNIPPKGYRICLEEDFASPFSC